MSRVTTTTAEALEAIKAAIAGEVAAGLDSMARQIDALKADNVRLRKAAADSADAAGNAMAELVDARKELRRAEAERLSALEALGKQAARGKSLARQARPGDRFCPHGLTDGQECAGCAWDGPMTLEDSPDGKREEGLTAILLRDSTGVAR